MTSVYRASHTPGPWKFHLGRGANPRLHIQTSAGYQIASTPEVNKHETREDDARLICAAPELLAACRDINTFFVFFDSHIPPGLGGGAKEALMHVKTAIAKATGAA